MTHIYYETKTGSFTKQITKTKSASKIEITTAALESGKTNDFTVNDGTVKGFTTIVNGVVFDVIQLDTLLINPNCKYRVYYPCYSFDAKTVCVGSEEL